MRKITVQSQLRQIVHEILSSKNHHKKGLVEWLKVQALSSNPSTAKKENKHKKKPGQLPCEWSSR
jgi:hypothetical protein